MNALASEPFENRVTYYLLVLVSNKKGALSGSIHHLPDTLRPVSLKDIYRLFFIALYPLLLEILGSAPFSKRNFAINIRLLLFTWYLHNFSCTATLFIGVNNCLVCELINNNLYPSGSSLKSSSALVNNNRHTSTCPSLLAVFNGEKPSLLVWVKNDLYPSGSPW